jgi:putative PIN family toxin of toxin-antitoxin system
MRCILDTNILIAALITRGTPPDQLYEAWRDGRFTLITSELQVEEFRRVSRREGIRFRIHQAEAGRLVNDLRRLATLLEKLPQIDVSPDPYDNFLLAMAEAGQADILVTGDKRHLLALSHHQGTRIVTARDGLALLGTVAR